MANKNLAKPTVHLNGTSRQVLEEQLSKAWTALDHALDALAQARPHGRDYYPQGGHAIRKALAEHEARIDAIRAVREEIAQLSAGLYDDQYRK